MALLEQVHLITSSVTQQLQIQLRPRHYAWNRPLKCGLFPESILLDNGKLLKEDKSDR